MRFLVIALAGGLAACAAQPAPPGQVSTGPGPGAPPLQQRAFEQPHSPNASAGVPSITGSNARGQPMIERSGAAGGDVGGTTSAPRPLGERSDKGG